MGRAERRAIEAAQKRFAGRSPLEIARGIVSFARKSERYAATLGARLSDEWVRIVDPVGPYWRRGTTQVRATIEGVAPDGWADVVVSVSTMRGAFPTRPTPALVREVAAAFLGPDAEHLPQLEALPGGAAMMVEARVLLRPAVVGQA